MSGLATLNISSKSQPCPACQELGRDTDGDNLRVFSSGAYHCIAVGRDKAHNKRIRELMPELGSERQLSCRPCMARPIPKPKRLNFLARIKEDFPATVVDLWEESTVRCDENLDEAKAFLRIFPSDALLWIADDVRKTGRPENVLQFRTRTEWELAKITAPGTRVAPSWFNLGAISRKRENVTQHLFVVIESDEIGDGKLYANKDEFCSLIRWLREACHWHLSAVVDSGNKSLHAWFTYPGLADMSQLEDYATELGLDNKFKEPSQPWRLPGVAREGSDQCQRLVYLDLGASL